MATTFKAIIDWPNGVGTLNANITAATESIVLSADPGTGMSTANFWVRCGYEQILVATRSGATLTCTGGRGANGTTAAAHASGATVTQDFFAGHVNAITTALNTAEDAIDAVESDVAAIQSAGALDALAITGASTFGGGYGSTGASIAADGNIQTNGALTVDGTSTLASVTVGGGYGSTGATIAATGNISTNGTLTVDGVSTFTGAVGVKSITVTCSGDGQGAPSYTSSAITNTAAEAPGISLLRATDAGSGVAGATTDGQTHGVIAAAGHNGTGYDSTAAIYFKQDGAVSGSNVPGKIEFHTATNAGGLSAALTINADKTARFVGAVGFNNAAPSAKPTISGSRGGNAALASLLTAGATIGLWTDGTS